MRVGVFINTMKGEVSEAYWGEQVIDLAMAV